MSFLWPELLWFLLVLPALVALYILALRRKKKLALKYASLSLVKDAIGAGNRIRRQDLLIPVGHDGRHQKLIDYFGQCLRACLYFGDVRSSRVLARSCR